MTFRIHMDTKKFAKVLHGTSSTLADEIRISFGQALLRFRTRFHMEQHRGRPGLHRRTMNLVRSSNIAVTDKGTPLERVRGVYSIGGDRARYAQIHEYGGVVKARGKLLAVPLTAAKTAAGVARGRPRDFDDVVFIQTKAGKKLLMRPTGPGGDLVPWWILLPSVTIPARMGLRALWKKAVIGNSEEMLRGAAERAFVKAGARSQ